MNEESTPRIKRSVLSGDQVKALVLWLKAQGDLTGKQHAVVAQDAKVALSIPVTLANLRHWARVWDVPLKAPRKATPPLAETVKGLSDAMDGLYRDHVKLGADVGQRLAMLEDTLATGGTLIARVKALEARDQTIDMLLDTVMAHGQGGTKHAASINGLNAVVATLTKAIVWVVMGEEDQPAPHELQDELRALLHDPPAVPDSLFETGAGKTSEESAAL
jgi:hypothetical protein